MTREVEGMKQVRIDGKVLAELSDDGTLYVYDDNVPDVDVEVFDGWPGT